MNTVPVPPFAKGPLAALRKISRHKRTDYATKLARNEAAASRWLTKLKLATTKLAKLAAQRKRITTAMTQKKQVKLGSAFTRKFS